jgi:tryptophan synthase alpha chain
MPLTSASSHRPSFVAYVTCGDPDLATTRAVILAAIDAGASVIELGVPFSDHLPMVGGPLKPFFGLSGE